MEELSRQNLKDRWDFSLMVAPYWRDHCFEDRAVLPAVEAMILLASAARRHCPEVRLNSLKNAQFSRLLELDLQAGRQEISFEIEKVNAGWSAALRSKLKMDGGVKRTLEHARVIFAADETLSVPPAVFKNIEKLEGDCLSVPSFAIYRELIPFGPSYRNIVGDLSVSQEGALAYLSGGEGQADDSLLGSPFVMDAAMHAACVWGQRFRDVVAFPVGFEQRLIYAPTRKGRTYLGRIVPLEGSREPLAFDVWIYDEKGVLCERIISLKMRNVTQGRLRPPSWIRE
jgi:hypothetical protein